jgi:hypothetical protein
MASSYPVKAAMVEVDGWVPFVQTEQPSIPNKPGVYFFFRRLRIIDCHNPEQFELSLAMLMRSSPFCMIVVDEHGRRPEPFIHVKFMTPTPHEEVTDILRKHLKGPLDLLTLSDRKQLSVALEACSLMMPPLRIGQASNLAERFKNHIQDGFLNELKNQPGMDTLVGSDFIFAWKVLPENLPEIVEAILIHLYKAPFNKVMGAL